MASTIGIIIVLRHEFYDMQRPKTFIPRWFWDDTYAQHSVCHPKGRAIMTMTLHKPAPRTTSGIARAPQPGIRDRRRKPRITLQPMYTRVTVRVLNEKSDPIDGHVLDLSEIGLAVEIDKLVPMGSPITIEFAVSGLGRLRGADWPTFAAAG